MYAQGQVFTPDPVERDHPLNQGCELWWLTLPEHVGGRRIVDLMGNFQGMIDLGPTSKWTTAAAPNHYASFYNYKDDNGIYFPSWIGDDAKFAGAITCAAWIRFAAFTGAEQKIISKCSSNGASNNLFDFRTSASATNLVLVRANTGYRQHASAGTGFVIGQWYHVAVTHDGISIGNAPRFYLNGRELGYDSSAGNSSSGAATGNGAWIRVGARGDLGTNQKFDGRIDDVRIYSRALDPVEIAALYAESRAGNPTTLRRFSSISKIFGTDSSAPVEDPLWTPAALGTALVAWFDASEESSFALGDNGVGGFDAVHELTSRVGSISMTRVGSIWHQTKPRWSATGRNGKPAFLFNGGDQILQSSYPTTFPKDTDGSGVFALAFADAAVGTSARPILDFGTFSAARDRFLYSSEGKVSAGMYGTNLSHPTKTWADQDHIVTLSHPIGASPLVALSVDGETSVSSTWTTPDTDETGYLNLGSFAGAVGGGTWYGAIQEVGVTNRPLTLDEEQKLQGYLAHKWGVSALLPSDHPYKAEPPRIVSIIPFPSNREFLAFGDSHMERSVYGTINSGGFGYRGLVRAQGVAGHIVPATGGRLRPAQFANFGVEGGTTIQADSAPRLNASNVTSTGRWWRGSDGDSQSSGSENKGVLNANSHGAGIIFYQLGTNDAGGTFTNATTWGEGGASRIAFDNIMNSFASDKLIVVFTVMPRGRKLDDTPASSGIMNSTQAALYKSFAEFQKTYAWNSGHANSKTNVIVVDLMTRWLHADVSAGGPNELAQNKPGITMDGGIHLNAGGSMDAALAAHEALIEAYGSTYTTLSSLVTTPTTNGLTGLANAQPFINSNPTMTSGTNGAVGGGAWGTGPVASGICQGWTLSGSGTLSGLTCTASKGSDSNGSYQRINVTGTLAAGLSANFFLSQVTNAASLNALGANYAQANALRCAAKYSILGDYIQDINVNANITSGTGGENNRATGASMGTGVAGGEITALGAPTPSAFKVADGSLRVMETEMFASIMPQMAAGYDTASPGLPTTLGSLTSRLDVNLRNPTASSVSINVDVYVYACGTYRTGSAYGEPPTSGGGSNYEIIWGLIAGASTATQLSGLLLSSTSLGTRSVASAEAVRTAVALITLGSRGESAHLGQTTGLGAVDLGGRGSVSALGLKFSSGTISLPSSGTLQNTGTRSGLAGTSLMLSADLESQAGGQSGATTLFSAGSFSAISVGQIEVDELIGVGSALLAETRVDRSGTVTYSISASQLTSAGGQSAVTTILSAGALSGAGSRNVMGAGSTVGAAAMGGDSGRQERAVGSLTLSAGLGGLGALARGGAVSMVVGAREASSAGGQAAASTVFVSAAVSTNSRQDARIGGSLMTEAALVGSVFRQTQSGTASFSLSVPLPLNATRETTGTSSMGTSSGSLGSLGSREALVGGLMTGAGGTVSTARNAALADSSVRAGAGQSVNGNIVAQVLATLVGSARYLALGGPALIKRRIANFLTSLKR